MRRGVVLEAMVRSALESARRAISRGMPEDRIILSAKVSGVEDLIHVYRGLAVASTHALHLGLTEAGMGRRGVVSSAAALAVLLSEGIGDTIRVSLTPAPGGDRAEEVHVCQEILQSLGLRSFRPQVTACPGCGRTQGSFFQKMAEDIDHYLKTRLALWKRVYPGIEDMKVAVMGCVVNGPGESKHANIGISLPGTGEDLKAPVFVDGQLLTTLRGETIVEDFVRILDEYAASRYGSGPSGTRPHLDLRTRNLCTVGALAALGRPSGLVELNVKIAMGSGASKEESLEVMLQMAPYAGFPAA